MSHYFIEDKTLPVEQKEIVYTIGGHDFRFRTQAGVFSRHQIDFASDVLLRTLPPLAGSLLDLGCGYGVIGVVLGKMYGLDVTMSDVNPLAVRLSEGNAALNGVAANIVLSDIYENIVGTFDTITVNPPIHAGKAVTYAMYEGAAARLNTGGRLVVVTYKKHGAESTMAKLRDVFGRCEVLYKKKGVVVLSVDS